jgi:hypothetical protein
MNKKLFFISLAIIFVIILAFYFFPKNSSSYSSCEGHYTLSCYDGTRLDTNHINITCSKDSDCNDIERMKEFCGPNKTFDLLKCVNAKYYCGEDNFCKGCDC